jgi:hypothetical protein
MYTIGHDVRTSQLHGKIDDPNDPARIAIK